MHAAQIERHGVEAVPLVAPLWEALFDHHLSLRAAGLSTVPREVTWPRRRAHYESLFTEHDDAGLWIAVAAGGAVGYAMAFGEQLGGRDVMVLETLSVLPAARGQGIGTRLMDAVDDAAAGSGIGAAAVDVVSGNTRSRALYLSRGFAPHTESWMRSCRPAGTAVAQADLGSLAEAARSLGFDLSTRPGPDDTWESADVIVTLAPTGPDWSTPEPSALGDLFALLESAGLWTIQCELPASPAAGRLREIVTAQGFRMSTERLIRRPLWDDDRAGAASVPPRRGDLVERIGRMGHVEDPVADQRH